MIGPDLDQLLDNRGACDAFMAAGLDVAVASPTYVRHKPETTVVAYELESSSGVATRAYVRWCADPERAAVLHAKALTKRPRANAAGPGVAMLGASAVYYGFPNDARLRRLRWYADARKIKRSLAEVAAHPISAKRSKVQVLRYKPERRLVAKIDLGGRHRAPTERILRYSTRPDGVDRHRVATMLRRAGVAVPTPLAVLDHGRVTLDEFLAGTEVRATSPAALPSPGAMAAALRRFHETPAVCTSVEEHDVWAPALAGLEGLTNLDPDLRAHATDTARLVCDRRGDAVTEPSALIHGDLHDRNILVHRDAVAFVDLERVRVGRASDDLGYFLGTALGHSIRHEQAASSTVELARATVDEYRRLQRVPLQNIRRAVALALVEQAVLCVRHLEPGYSDTTALLLTEAQSRLAPPTTTGVEP